MSFRLTLPEARYPTPASRLALFQAMLERARAVPGIEAIGLTTNLPFDRRTNSTIFDIADLPRQATEPERHANLRFVDGGFFRTLGIPLLEGRTFDARDAAGAPGAVIVDAELVREHFGDRDPIGATIDMGGTATIVGVVGSVKHGELGEPLKPTIYLAHPQYGWVQGMQVAVRSAMPLAELERTMRSIVRSLDATLPIAEVTTVPDLIHRSLGTRRIAMTVLSGFAALSLLLALLGVYGVLSYATAERTREIGIRMALGAEPRDVVRMVLRSGVLLAVLGLAIGAALFLVAGRVMRGLLYGVGPDDPVTLVAAAGVLTVAAVVACWIPARRAARLSPVVALKNE
jgi:predicted permease